MKPLFFNSLNISDKPVELKNHEVKRVKISNESDLTYKLKKRQPSIGFKCPDEITLEAHKTVMLQLEGVSEEIANAGVLKMYYEVENLWTLDGDPLPVVFEIANK